MIFISLIHPSRGRPQKAAATFKHWMAQAAHPERIEHILSLDFSDTHNEQYQINAEGKHEPWANSRTIIDYNTCVVEATNQAAKLATGDILLYLSDDFDCPLHWDELICARLDPTLPQLLRVNDGYQPMENFVLTIPIMTRPLYTQLGYFFFPEFKSMWVDVHLFFTCKEYMIVAPDLVFPHLHYVTGACEKDETYTRSDANWNQGIEIFNRDSTKNGWGIAYNKMP